MNAVHTTEARPKSSTGVKATAASEPPSNNPDPSDLDLVPAISPLDPQQHILIHAIPALAVNGNMGAIDPTEGDRRTARFAGSAQAVRRLVAVVMSPLNRP